MQTKLVTAKFDEKLGNCRLHCLYGTNFKQKLTHQTCSQVTTFAYRLKGLVEPNKTSI